MSTTGRRLVLRADGACRGNPGPGAIGVVLEDGAGAVVAKVSRAIGITTNNQAEYKALRAGLEVAEGLGAEHLDIRLDSELVVRQLLGQYRVKDHKLKPLHQDVVAALARIPAYSITHVPRSENYQADRLAAEALNSSR